MICKLAKYGLILAWFCLLLHGWSVTVMDEDKVALEDYRGEVPFATMADLAGEDAQDYRPTMQGMSFNAVRAWSDVLAPRCMKWAEHAAVTEADGNVLDGGLYVSYYELRSEALAPWLLKELYHKDMREVKEDQPLELPPLAADQAAAYRDRAHTPTLIFRKGRVVVRASFYSFSPEGYGLPDWAPILADSVGPD